MPPDAATPEPKGRETISVFVMTGRCDTPHVQWKELQAGLLIVATLADETSVASVNRRPARP